MYSKSGRSYRGILRLFLSFFLVIAYLPVQSYAQLAKGRSKFLGNVINAFNIPSNFRYLWNQATPENAGKWGSV